MWWIFALLMSWVLVNMKSRRPDGVLLSSVHPYRQVMNHILPTQSHSWVLFDSAVDAEPLLAFIARERQVERCDVMHCVAAAAAMALHSTPELNRFVVGQRIYQRYKHRLTFAVKRDRLDVSSKVATVMLDVPPELPFVELCRRMNKRTQRERSDVRTEQDQKLEQLLRIPRPLLNAGVRLSRWADAHNLLPRQVIDDDPLFASVIITSLGSLGLAAAYHHLFDWGNCPFVITIGKIEARPVARGQQVLVRQQLPLRVTLDERIADGALAARGLARLVEVLESPEQFLGGFLPSKAAAAVVSAPL